MVRLVGEVAGDSVPVTGRPARRPNLWLAHPDALFGNLLFPIVSLSVAVILFEGSLTLKFKKYYKKAIPLFAITAKGRLRVFDAETDIKAGPGWTTLSLIEKDDDIKTESTALQNAEKGSTQGSETY